MNWDYIQAFAMICHLLAATLWLIGFFIYIRRIKELSDTDFRYLTGFNDGRKAEGNSMRRSRLLSELVEVARAAENHVFMFPEHDSSSYAVLKSSLEILKRHGG